MSSFRKTGFTLIELLVVLAIIGILIGLAIAAFAGSRAAARDAQRKSDLEAIRSAVELYKSDNRRYPGWGSGFTGGGWGFVDDLTILQPNYLQSIPRDPLYAGSNADCYQHYLYAVDGNGTRYTIFSRLERTAVPKPAPSIEICSSGDNWQSCTVDTGTCNGWNFKYWTNNP